MKTDRNFSVCLRDFLGRFGNSATSMIMDELGVREDIPRSWLHDVTPKGFEKLKLIFLLDSVGYKLTELEAMHTVAADAARCIAYDFLDVDTVYERLNINNKRFFEFVWSIRIPNNDRIITLQSILDPFAEKIKSEMEKRRNALSQRGLMIGDSDLSRINDNVSAQPQTDVDVLIKRFDVACGVVREIGAEMLQRSMGDRVKLRKHLNPPGEIPRLHTTFETIHRLLKEKKTNE